LTLTRPRGYGECELCLTDCVPIPVDTILGPVRMCPDCIDDHDLNRAPEQSLDSPELEWAAGTGEAL
jgi:hypothetical protein